MRYRRTRRSAMLSATVQSFLPYKLEPLGLSLSGQLRVAYLSRLQMIYLLRYLKLSFPYDIGRAVNGTAYCDACVSSH
jgi:hypothetical protein